uniref:translation initiation factor 2 n=1 Tax=Rhodaphanes brevistipitata TaxID=446136 RepID=UPI001FCCF377|nr:translation initiation factor 2 [Rhodaphanes brevistipitata]UNJ18473.1 translation initiation factor 2 [Rhodaphanes brevistipitata]
MQLKNLPTSNSLNILDYKNIEADAFLWNKLSVLNKPRRKKNILELNNPKIVKSIRSKDKSTNPQVATISSSSQEENSSKTNDFAAKNKNKKDLTSQELYAGKDSKSIKSKGKRKVKNYYPLDEETNILSTGETNSIMNLNTAHENKAQLIRKKRNANNSKKNKKELEYLSEINDFQVPQQIIIKSPIAIKELAELLNKTETELIKFLFLQGKAVTINEVIDINTAKSIAEHYGSEIVESDEETIEKTVISTIQNNTTSDINSENLEKRAPVVAVLGHVDHGKTSLLDQVRGKRTVEEEAGGITQGLNAYNVNLAINNKEEKIVFLDTPGHAAFTQMRSRGALIMDIGILVVAADDEVQPQTIESIQAIQAAGVPLIVALNKIDKKTANVDKIKDQLADHNVISEEWGGENIFVPISALNGTNIQQLLESIVLVAEILNLRASRKGPGKGIIIESHLDKNKGVAVTVLVQSGTFSKGNIIATETKVGKIRMMNNESQEIVDSAGPSEIIKLWGFNEIPAVGIPMMTYQTEKEARAQIKENKSQQLIPSNLLNISEYSLQQKVKIFNIIIKSNTQGSLEAVFQMIKEIPQSKVAIKILSAAPGEITETDVLFASTTKSVIIGFDTTLAPGAKVTASRLGIIILESSIIYNLLDHVETEMSKLLDPEYSKEEVGIAIVKDVFALAKGTVAGCYVTSGKLMHNSKLEVIRQNKVIYEGNLDSLKRVKEDVSEISSGNECGILVKNFQDWNKEDEVKAFELTPKIVSLSE